MKFTKEEEGATAVEYAIMVAAISGLIIVIVFSLGVKVFGLFNNFYSLWP